MAFVLRRTLLALSLGLLATPIVFAQAIPAGRATPPNSLSVFVAATDTHTGFLFNNRSLTAGTNFSLRRFFTFEPAVELRGTLSVASPSDSAKERNFLAGPVLRRKVGRIEPYGDILFGVGAINYPGTYIYNDNVYVRTTSSVTSYGGGINLFLTRHFLFKADYQQQHWNVPILASGTAEAHSVSLGIARRFDIIPHPKEIRDKDNAKWHKLHEDFPGLSK